MSGQMSQPKKQKVNITNQQLLFRLMRLDIARRVPIDVFIAYIGLQLVNHGKVVPFSKAIKVIKKSKLNNTVKYKSGIPCENILEALIYLVIFKRKLVKEIIDNEAAEIWDDELAAPIFDIMKDIMEIYKI